MADDTSGTGSASMSISSGAEISDNDGQVHELHATSTPTDHTIGQAHYDKREAHYDTNYDVDPEAPGGKTHSLGHDGDHEAGYEGDDDDEDQVQDIRNDQKGSKDSKERPTRIASARVDEGSETAVKHKPSTSQDEDENGNDKASIPASSFEDVANRSARTATTVSNGEASSSESDSEDIFVGPRNSQYESSNANETPRSRFSVMGGDEFHPRSESPSPTSDEAGAENLNSRSDNVSSSEENDDSGEDGSSDEDEGKVHDVSSGLSDLSSTPGLADPELGHPKTQQKRHPLHVCKCEGWCSCERYMIFAGFGPNEMDDDAPHGIPMKNIGESDATSARDRALEVDADQEGDEDVTENTTSRRENRPIDSVNERHEADVHEEDEDEFPSQTHLSERVLAGELFAESGMRSTIEDKKRRCDSEDERGSKKIRVGQVFSWDCVAKPPRPPTGWVGGVWLDGCDKTIPAPREIQDSDHEFDDEVKV